MSGLSEIPAEFNEAEEEGTVLRTLVDFRIFGPDGHPLSFSDIGEGKPPARIEGTLLEPLAPKWKDKLMEILCSRPPPIQPLATGVVSAQPPVPVPISDWEKLAVGDLVDGFCTRTLKWYEAKIMEIDNSSSPDNPQGQAKAFKIHFKRWKSKYDEWITRGSPRLSLHGTTTERKPIPYSAYTPWFENTIAYQKLEELLGPVPKRKTLSVVIDGIEDCCLDFMYANPSLWVIAADNSWYRIAGPLVPSGCRPHTLYEPIFFPFAQRFAVAAHIAYCLIDFLPQNRKLSLSDVTSEIETMTDGLLNEHVILSNAEFIAQQIESLVHPDDWDQQISFTESLFLTQLKKRGPIYLKTHLNRSASGLNQSSLASPESLSHLLFDLSLRKPHSSSLAEVAKRNGSAKAAKLTAVVEDDPVGAQRTAKGIPIPFPDDELWELQLQSGVSPTPFPFSDKTQLPDPIGSSLSAEEMTFLPLVLRIWSILHNFRSLFSALPIFPLEDLLSLLKDSAEMSSCAQTLLREMHVSCLELLLKDRKVSELSFTPVLSSQQQLESLTRSSFNAQEAATADPSAAADGNLSLGRAAVRNSVTLWEILPQMSSPVSSEILRTGEAWVEVSRLLLSERMDPFTADVTVVHDYADFVGELAFLIENLAKSPAAQSLSCSSALELILEKILSGGYEDFSCSSSAESYVVGDRLDAYCSLTRCWHEAQVLEVLSPAFNEAGSRLKLLFPHSWITPREAIVEASSRYTAPLFTLSHCEHYRRVHPDNLPVSHILSLRAKAQSRQTSRSSQISPLASLQAIAADVRQVLQKKLEGQQPPVQQQLPDSLQDKQSAALQLHRAFEAGLSSLLADHDLHLAALTSPASASSSCTLHRASLSSLLGSLATTPYALLSFQSRVLLLHWLCGEMSCSSSAKLFLDDIAERKWKFERDFKAKRAPSVIAFTASSSAPSVAREPMATAAAEEEKADDEDQESPPNGNGNGSQRSTRTKRGRSVVKTLQEQEQALQELEEEAPPPKRGRPKQSQQHQQQGHSFAGNGSGGGSWAEEEEAFLSQVELRCLPLGADRHGRRYWRFSHDSHPWRLYCEDPQDGVWFTLTEQRQHQELLNWLSLWGRNESKLKQRLLSWDPFSPSSGLLYDDSFPVPPQQLQSRYASFLESLQVQQQGEGPMLSLLSLRLSDKGQMEAGVKDIEGRIVLTTFKLNDTDQSAAQLSGLRIADQFLSVGGVWIEDIQTLQRCLKTAAAASVAVSVVVLRYAKPLRSALLRAASDGDAEFKRWLERQQQLSPLPLSVSSAAAAAASASASQSLLLLGSVVQLLYALTEPWVTHCRWKIDSFKPAMVSFISLLSSSASSSSVPSPLPPSALLVTALRRALLEAEAGLWVSKRALREDWLLLQRQHRTRHRWRVATENSQSLSSFSLSLALLRSAALNWPLLDSSQSCVPLAKCRELIPKQSLEAYLPTVGDQFLYFPDGHRECLDILRLRHGLELPLSELPGSADGTLEALSGRVFLCQAVNLRYYRGGGGAATMSCPYFRLDFRVLSPPSSPLPPSLSEDPSLCAAPSSSSSLLPIPLPTLQLPVGSEKSDAKRYRLFNRVLNILYGLPEAEAFIHPVSATECPDYRTLITQPMHLVEVARRVKQQTYRSPSEFLSAIDLIRSNCRLYCAERFPELVADAEVLYATAVAAVAVMDTEFLSCCCSDNSSDSSLVSPLLTSASSPALAPTTLPPQELDPEQSQQQEQQEQGGQGQGQVWTVFVPLNKALTEQEFLVSLAIYSKACSLSRRQYTLEDKVCMRRNTSILPATSSAEGVSSVESQYGSIVGCKPQGRDPFLPWRWLKVEWDLLDDLFGEVNPWEILLASKPTPGPSSGGPRPPNPPP